ncbi:hypothetical protein [Actinomadura rugatobispora]|uniref:Amidohydrolase n=1 Tax=Actinomadura rugatobispora TaxID=1994 RepID=A0ABW1ACF4_9ACTN|nr:hypothetical protein GCM10010200_079630 [Actinomadura rugatobispora]
MPSRELPFPLFDADNHMYETEEAFTRHLPEDHRGAIQYVQVRGRTKIAVRGQISEYIPNPTFEVVARPGAQEDYFKHGNPEGKSFHDPPQVPAGVDGRAGHPADADVPRPGEPAGRTGVGRPGAHAW